MPTVYIVGSNSNFSASRQSRIKSLKEGDLLRIVREPDNEYDPFAIKVTTIKTKKTPSKDLGYIPKQFSHLLTEVMKTKKKKH